jgi:hypothetical protein
MGGWIGEGIDGRGRRMKRRSSSRMDVWLDGKRRKQDENKKKKKDGWMDGWVDGWDGWIDGRRKEDEMKWW